MFINHCKEINRKQIQFLKRKIKRFNRTSKENIIEDTTYKGIYHPWSTAHMRVIFARGYHIEVRVYISLCLIWTYIFCIFSDNYFDQKLSSFYSILLC